MDAGNKCFTLSISDGSAIRGGTPFARGGPRLGVSRTQTGRTQSRRRAFWRHALRETDALCARRRMVPHAQRGNHLNIAMLLTVPDSADLELAGLCRSWKNRAWIRFNSSLVEPRGNESRCRVSFPRGVNVCLLRLPALCAPVPSSAPPAQRLLGGLLRKVWCRPRMQRPRPVEGQCASICPLCLRNHPFSTALLRRWRFIVSLGSMLLT